MNLRSRETVIHENLKHKQDSVELHEKVFNLLFELDQKMNTIIDIIQKTQYQKIDIIQELTGDKQKKIPEKIIDSVPMFIPSLDSNTLKGNVQELKKKIRKSNIDDSIDKLSKLQDNP